MAKPPPFPVRWKRRLGHGWRLVGILARLAHQGRNPAQFPKYLPARAGADGYVLDYVPVKPGESLPVPPPDLWLGYGSDAESYVASGKRDVDRMLEIAPLPLAGAANGVRILDLGCGGGRMIRHLPQLCPAAEIWGTDISADHINWLKTHLSPPCRFATTTTIPHLPFPDDYFDYVYCGSLFTHIEDLADAWLLEVARILRPNGTFFSTFHDEAAAAEIVREGTSLGGVIDHDPNLKGDLVVVGRDSHSNVFYRSDYLRHVLSARFDVVRIEPGAYGYQTGWVMHRKPA